MTLCKPSSLSTTYWYHCSNLFFYRWFLIPRLCCIWILPWYPIISIFHRSCNWKIVLRNSEQYCVRLIDLPASEFDIGWYLSCFHILIKNWKIGYINPMKFKVSMLWTNDCLKQTFVRWLLSQWTTNNSHSKFSFVARLGD